MPITYSGRTYSIDENSLTNLVTEIKEKKQPKIDLELTGVDFESEDFQTLSRKLIEISFSHRINFVNENKNFTTIIFEQENRDRIESLKNTKGGRDNCSKINPHKVNMVNNNKILIPQSQRTTIQSPFPVKDPKKLPASLNNNSKKNNSSKILLITTRKNLELPSKNDYLGFFNHSQETSINDLFAATKPNHQSIINIILSKKNDMPKDQLKVLVYEFNKFSLNYDNCNLRGLTDIYLVYGFYALVLVLKQINNMGLNLVKDFLTERESFLRLSSQDGLDKLSELASLSHADKLWWRELIKRHKEESTSKLNFCELYKAFNNFRLEMVTQVGSLPETFPLTEVRLCKMQYILDNVRNIVINAQDPKVQILFLANLPLDTEGYHELNSEKKYKILTKEMGLQKVDNQPFDENIFATLMLIKVKDTTTSALEDEYSNSLKYFYQFIARNTGTNSKRFKYQNFKSLAEGISTLNENFSAKVEKISFCNEVELKKYDICFIENKDKNNKIISLTFIYSEENVTEILCPEDTEKIIKLKKSEHISIQDLLLNKYENETFYSFIINNLVKSNISLSPILKSSLLYIAAVSCSGPAANKLSCAPHEALKDFLKALRLFVNNNTQFKIDDIIIKIHEIGLNSKTCPNLTDLTVIIKNLSNTDMSNVSSDTMSIIENAFKLVKNYGELAVDIIGNLSIISSRNKQDIADLLEINLGYDFKDFDEKTKPFIAKMASLFVDKIPPYTLQLLGSLEPEIQNIFLQKLITIDLSKSATIMSASNLLDLLNYLKTNRGQEPKTTIQQFFLENNLDINFNSTGNARSKIDLQDTVKSLMAEYNKLMNTAFMQKIKYFLPGPFKVLDEYITQIDKISKSSKFNQPELLKVFDELDSRVLYLKEQLTKETLGLIKSLALKFGQEQTAYINAFFNTYSLAVFLDKAIELTIKDKISSQVADVFGQKKEALNTYLTKHITKGSKVPAFGIVKTDIDPSAPNNFNGIKNLLCYADGIVLYNDNLYHIEQNILPESATNNSLKVTKLNPSASSKIEAIEKLKKKINDNYQPVGRDGYRIIKLDVNIGKSVDIDIIREEAIKKSLKQDAIIESNGKYYYYNFVTKTLENKNHQALPPLFTENQVLNREALTQEKTSIKEIIRVCREENSLISEILGFEPIIFPSQIIDSYNIKLDELTEFLTNLANIKDAGTQLFTKYIEILDALREKAAADELISVFDRLSFLFPGAWDLVFENLALIYENTKNDEKISLGSLLASLTKLKEQKDLEIDLKELLKTLIPFTLKGQEFPLNIFIAHKGVPKELLNSLLSLAPELGNDFNNFFTGINGLKNKFHDDINTQNTIDLIISVLLLALLEDTSKIGLYNQICEIINLLNEEKLQKYANIFKALRSLKAPIQLEDVKNILEKLSSRASDLDAIQKTFFTEEPYLDKNKFLEVLGYSDVNFKEYLNYYDLHPYQDTNRQVMADNFRTDKVLDVIDGILKLPGNVPLGYVEREKLVKEFFYVNALSTGKDPLYVDGKAYYLHEDSSQHEFVSRDELTKIATTLKEKISASCNSSENSLQLFANDNRREVLQYIAVMREIYYRTTKIIPNSTQIITIINALNNPSRQFQEIETAEGKSVTTALFSALLGIKGCAVVVPTSSENLVNQDYFEKHNNLFFKALGFKTGVIDGQNFLEPGGIYYGTSRDIDSLIAKYKLGLINADCPLACVQDEQDTVLDDLAVRSIVVPSSADNQLSPAWIISAINRFVETDDFKRIKPQDNIEPKDERQDLENLITFLRMQASINKDDSAAATEQVNEYLPVLKNYLAFACQVHGYKEGIDFQIIEKDLKGNDLDSPVATPMNPVTKEVERGNTFPDGRQAFLHELLNHRQRLVTKEFAVTIDPLDIDIKTNKSLATDFKYFIGLSATNGDNQELLERGFPGSKIPPHRPKNRKILSTQIVSNTTEKYKAIIDAVRINGLESDLCPTFILNILAAIVELYHKTLEILFSIFGKSYTRKDKQPILIFVDNPVEAKQLYDEFEKINLSYNLQYIDGTETIEQYDNKIDKAGKGDSLTIVLPKDGRGIDYDSDHPKGIFGIKAFNSHSRTTEQVLGRVGRKGKPGKFLDIVEDSNFVCNSRFQKMFGVSKKLKQASVKDSLNKFSTELARKRYFHQEKDARIQIILKKFDCICNKIDQKAVENQMLLQLRVKLVSNIKLIIDNLLYEEKSKIDDLIVNFENSLANMWSSFVAEEYPTLVASFPDKMQLIKSELEQNIKNEFWAQKTEVKPPLILEPRIQKVSRERTARIINRYEDALEVVLEFDKEFIENAGLVKSIIAKRLLKSIFDSYKWLQLKYEEDKTLNDNFAKLINYIYQLESNHELFKFFSIEKEIAVVHKYLQAAPEFKTKFSQNEFSKLISAYLSNNLDKVRPGLRALGIKTPWVDETIKRLKDLIPGEDHSTDLDKIYNLYKDLYRIKTFLDNNHSILPLTADYIGAYDLQKLIKQTIEYIDYLAEFSKENAQELNKYKEAGQCAGLFDAYLPQKELEAVAAKVTDIAKGENYTLKPYEESDQSTLSAQVIAINYIDERFYYYVRHKGEVCKGTLEGEIFKKDLSNIQDPALKREVLKQISKAGHTQCIWYNLILSIEQINNQQEGFCAIDEILEFLYLQNKSIGTQLSNLKSTKNLSKALVFSIIDKFVELGDYQLMPLDDLIKKLEKIRSKMMELKKNTTLINDDFRETAFKQDNLYLEKKTIDLKKNLDSKFDREHSQIKSLKIVPGYFANNQIYDLIIEYDGEFDISRLGFSDVKNEKNYDMPKIKQPTAQNLEGNNDNNPQILIEKKINVSERPILKKRPILKALLSLFNNKSANSSQSSQTNGTTIQPVSPSFSGPDEISDIQSNPESIPSTSATTRKLAIKRFQCFEELIKFEIESLPDTDTDTDPRRQFTDNLKEFSRMTQNH